MKVRVLEPIDFVSDGDKEFVGLKPGQIVDMSDRCIARLAKLKKVARMGNLVEPDVHEFLESTVQSTIATIEIKRAREVYGKNAIEPDRETVVVYAKNGARLLTSLPRGVTYENGQWVITDKEAAKKFLKNKASKFGAFLRKYERWPRVGDEVETLVNGNGIGRICIAEAEKPNDIPKPKRPAKAGQRKKVGGRKSKTRATPAVSKGAEG